MPVLLWRRYCCPTQKADGEISELERHIDMKTLIKRLLGITRLEQQLEASRIETAYLKGLLNERYTTDWKLTKDGKRRYRKVATKVLVNAWHTESESIEAMSDEKKELPHGLLYGTDTIVTGWEGIDEA
jgi:hypothetical protein